MTTMALVLINPQVHLFEPDPVYNGPVVLERLVALTTRARAPGVSVVFGVAVASKPGAASSTSAAAS